MWLSDLQPVLLGAIERPTGLRGGFAAPRLGFTLPNFYRRAEISHALSMPSLRAPFIYSRIHVSEFCFAVKAGDVVRILPDRQDRPLSLLLTDFK